MILIFRPVTGIFVLLKKCPKIKFILWDKIFVLRKMKNFVLGQKFSDKICPEKAEIRVKAIVSL